MKKQFYNFCFRWLVNSLGLMLAASLLAGIHLDGGWQAVLIAGLLLALINVLIRPIIIILSLPAIFLSLGMFTIFINGLMIVIADQLHSGLMIDNYGQAILAGLIVGLVNYLVTVITER